jgi:hypothetical protein
MNRRMIKRANAAVRAACLAALVLSLLMTVPGSVAAPQEEKTAVDGLTGGTEETATAEILEGRWSAFHVYIRGTGSEPGKWKHAGPFTITKFEDGLRVTFSENGGGDDPKAENKVKFAGNAVILDRAIAPPFVDPDTNAEEKSQTWMGRLFKDDDGWKIEGRVVGAGMTWNTKHGNAATFLAVKQ